MEPKTIDRINVSLILALGIILLLLSFRVFDAADASCSSSLIKNGWMIIAIIATMFMAGGIGYWLCNSKYQLCYSGVQNRSNIFSILLLIFSLMLVGVTFQMKNELKKDEVKQTCNVSVLKSSIDIAFYIGILFTLIGVARLFKKSA